MLYDRPLLKLVIDQRIVEFWARIVEGKTTNIYHLLLNYLIKDSFENGISYNWVEKLISLFNNLCMLYIYIYNIKRR